MRYDSIIIGTGPAGLEAALNLKIREKNFLLIGSTNLSSKVRKAPKIENYLGLPSISGKALSETFLSHLANNQISITPGRVTAMYPMGDYFSVATVDDLFETTTVILAPGVYAANPFPGEESFLGKGVGYCATCDAPLYRDKIVAIVGTSPEAEQEANFVAEIAKTVYYIPVGAAPTLLVPAVQLVTGKVQEIRGTTNAETLVLNTGEIQADGIFILRESIAPSALLPGLVTEGAHILVDAQMATNLPGCFAAGDCVGRPYQYIRAAGQGLTAAHSAVSYLANLANPQ